MREYISVMWLFLKKRYERVYKGNIYSLFGGDDSVQTLKSIHNLKLILRKAFRKVYRLFCVYTITGAGFSFYL